jgi:hypothetical protein
MKENEKIAYAMEHYTEGCVYIHPEYNCKKKYTFEKQSDNYNVFCNGNVNAGQGMGYLYYNNQWATVIKQGIEPDWVAIAKIKYPEGTTYICPFLLKTHKLIVKDDTYKILVGTTIKAGCNLGYLRYNEAWATIVEDEKIDKFEVGKWYKRDTGTYIKFLKLEDNVFVASEIILYSDLKHYNEEGKFGNITYSSYTLLTDLTEIQEYLPDGHVDKINKEINMFKKGDYIVLLAGITDNDWQLNYCYKQRVDSRFINVEKDCSQDKNGWGVHPFHKIKNDWRYATPEETAEYNRLDKPFDVTILDKKYNYEVVHCITQKQIDFLINKCSATSALFKAGLRLKESLSEYPEGIAINQKDDGYCGLNWYKSKNSKIYTFNEWCTKMNYVFPVDKILDRIDELTNPTYVECIKSKSSSYKIGKIYKVDEKGSVVSGCNPTAKWNNTNDYQSKFKPSTTDDWNAQEINKTNGEIARIKRSSRVGWDNSVCYSQQWKSPLISIDPYEEPKNTNLIKVLYTKSKQKTISKEKIKKVKFLNVNINKIN